MPLEDFTSYTEVDPNSHITKTANHIDFAAYYNEDAYVYKDKLAGHFGSTWEHLITVKAINRSLNIPAVCEGLANAVESYRDAGNEIGFFIYYSNGAVSYRIYLFEWYSSVEYVQAYSISVNTPYYLTIKKDGTALTCKIYSDAARTNLLTTLSLTLHADESYRYIYAAQTQNTGSAGWIDVDIDDLDLQEGVLKEVTDSISLAESILRDKTLTISDSVASLDSLLANKTLQITDTITILETILRDKTFTVSDSIGLSELVTVITGGILKEVLDTIGLSEQVKIDKSLIIQDAISILDQIFRHKPEVTITDAVALAEIIAVSKLLAITDSVSIADVVYAMKTLPIYDQITVTDQVSTPSRILQALDAIGLSDAFYVNKTLIITDQIALAEVVEVGKGGAAKTKLFLIFGDLAIQIQ